MTEPRERLARECAAVDWPVLRAHQARGALILVAPELDLVDVATRVAADDTQAVQGWLLAGQLGKPTPLQVARWEAQPGISFQVLIVQPYVLAQGPL